MRLAPQYTPRTVLLVAAVGALAAAGLGVSATAAARGWSKPTELVGKRTPHTGGALLGAGPGRYAVAVFSRGKIKIVDLRASAKGRAPNGSIQARTRGASGRWGPTVIVSGQTRSNRHARLAVGANGATVLAWLDRDRRITVSTRSPTSGWSDPQRVTPSLAGGDLPEVDFDLDVAADGSAVLAWTARQSDGSQTLGSVLRSGTGEWGSPVTHLEGLDTPFAPAASATSGGGAAILQAPVCPLSGPAELASVLIFDGVNWGPETPVPGSECANDSDYAVGIELGPEGKSTMLFGGGPADGIRDVRLAVWPSSSEPAAAERISRGGVASGFARLGQDASGRIALTWSFGNGGNPRGIAGYLGTADGPIGRVRRINRKPARGSAQLAVADAGSGVAAWQSRRAPYSIRAAILRPGWQRFSADRKVSHRLASGFLNRPAVAAGSDGHLYVGWTRTTKRAKARGVYVSHLRVR